MPKSVFNLYGIIGSADDSKTVPDFEQEILQNNHRYSKLKNRELNARIWIKWLAVILAIAVIGSMAAILYKEIYGCGQCENNNLNSMIALIVGPITSITAITVAFLIGAFRIPEDKKSDDMSQNIPSNAISVASLPSSI